MRPTRGDEGAGTVLAISVVAVVGLLGLMLAGVGSAVGARSLAQAAADLAALAAGDVLAVHFALQSVDAQSADAVCGRAREVAERNGARLEGCVTEPGAVVVVRVSRQSPLGRADAAARAGPGRG